MEFKYEIFDTHAHYDDEAFSEDREEVLAQIREEGVVGILNCACSKASLETTNKLTIDYDFIYSNNNGGAFRKKDFSYRRNRVRLLLG